MRWSPSEPLESRGFEWYRGRKQLRQLLMQRLGRYRHTSRTGTFFEAQRLAKRVLDLHLVEREPCLKSGAEQQIVNTAKVEGQDRRCHIVPFQCAWHARGKGRGGNTKTQHGAHAGSPTPQSTTGEALLMREQQT